MPLEMCTRIVRACPEKAGFALVPDYLEACRERGILLVRTAGAWGATLVTLRPPETAQNEK